ncbi:MAG: hypothetical protein MMC33_008812 [Icmadophila ericetorum]|nr:hypothetical protein [Icmadophila ericetorum]
MESINIEKSMEQLDDTVDDLEEALLPILNGSMSDAAAYLRLNGVEAKEHPVFRELVRVKEYFEKIKKVEDEESKRVKLSLDKAAASRFIKHALAQGKDATGGIKGPQ